MLHKLTLAVTFLSLALFLPGILLANRGVISPMTGMGFFVLGGLLGLIAVLLAVVVMWRTRQFAVALLGTFGLMPLLVLVAAIADGARYPVINDITTDLDQVPAFTHAASLEGNAGRDLGFPPDFAAIIREGYPALAPMTLPLQADLAYERALDLAKTRMKGWEVTHEDAAARTFEAVASTRLLRFQDDVVVRVTPVSEVESRVDMRSKSREGKGDMGANARRIGRFFRELALKR